MGNLTKHFDRHEFRCRGTDCCGHSAPINLDLVKLLDILRDRLGVPLTVNSGFRCIRHNAQVHGDPNSRHCLGLAADLPVPPGLTLQNLWRAIFRAPTIPFGGIGLYPQTPFIHLDIAEAGRRWSHFDGRDHPIEAGLEHPGFTAHVPLT